jgi:hypothetical protein
MGTPGALERHTDDDTAPLSPAGVLARASAAIDRQWDLLNDLTSWHADPDALAAIVANGRHLEEVRLELAALNGNLAALNGNLAALEHLAAVTGALPGRDEPASRGAHQRAQSRLHLAGDPGPGEPSRP